VSSYLAYHVDVEPGHGAGHEALTWLLVGIMLIIGAVTIALLMLARLGRFQAGDDVPLRDVLSIGAAAVSGEAAIIHFAVIGGHFREWWVAGVGFAVVAWFQAGWAVVYLLRPSHLLRLLAIVVNGGVIGVWLLSRLVGLPVGPDAWRLEPIGSIDMVATALESSLVVLLVLSMVRRFRVRRVAAAGALQYGISVLAIVALVITLALAGAFGDAHLDGSHPVESPMVSPEG
jgi:hypothetical protein